MILWRRPLVSTNNRNGMQRNLREGQVQQWNLTLQYLLTKNTLLEAAYHGSKSPHLMSSLDYNGTNPFSPQPPDFELTYPYPQLGSVNIYESRAAQPTLRWPIASMALILPSRATLVPSGSTGAVAAGAFCGLG